MRRFALLASIWLIAALPVRGGEPTIRWVEFETTVNPVTVKRITKAIDEAEAVGDSLVLIRLDTPGGDVSSMEKVVKRILKSEVPVAAWVGPPGAKAASAGFFILISTDVAAMAHGTRTGAASPIFATGQGDKDSILLNKISEDLAALIRSMAQARGRDVGASADAVFEAKAYEETVALDKGLIDLIADDRDELVEKLNGREVRRFDGSTVTLELTGARFVTTEFSWRHDFMEFLGNPTVAYVLLMLALLGIYVEFTHPGAVFPGVVGALCLLLFALASTSLPVSAIGVLLVLLAIVMFILEIKVVSYGMLTVGGILALVIGSLMLFEGPIPELTVPPSVVLPVSITLAALCALVVWLAVRAQRERVDTGREGLAGQIGVVTHDLSPEGKVFVHGEIWDATCPGGNVPENSRVRVVRVDDLKLVVEPADSGPPERS